MVQFNVDIYKNGTFISFDCDPNNLTAFCEEVLQAYGTVNYVPTLAGNALYLAIFFLILIIQIAQGFIYKTWSFTICMMCGLILEAVGYGSRIGMHLNPWDSNPFLAQLIVITIAPIFFTACVYRCLSKLIPLYDPNTQFALFRPRTYQIVFLSIDFLCLVLQAVGGALADTANTNSEEWNGVHIMIAGLALQVASLVAFSFLCAHFAWRLRSAGIGQPEGFEGKAGRTLNSFIFGVTVATILILVRCCFRVAELKDGFGGKLANEEIPLMILEGAMMILTTLFLTVFHPGRCLGGAWRAKTSAATKETGSR